MSDPLAQAWALKDAAYASWSSEPTRAAQSARELDALAQAHPGLPLIAALARWADGIAALAAAEMAAALAALEAAEAALQQCGEPLAAAQTLVPRIVALAMLGRHDDSIACAEVARRRLQALGDTVGAAKVNLNLAALHIRRNDGQAAIEPARRAGALFARSGDHEHSVMADVSLADALVAVGDLDEALRIYARAGARAAAHGLPVLQALVEESRALVELVRGRWRDALAGLESARRRYATLGMVQHQAIAEKQLADVYLELRLLPEALAIADDAVQRFAVLDAPDERGWALVQRALARRHLGHLGAAEADLGEAGELFDRLHHDSGVAAVLLARAELAALAGQPEHASDLARQALQRGGEAMPAAQRWRAEATMAQSLLDTGAAEPARERFEHLLRRADELQLLRERVQALTGLGAVALGRGDTVAARLQWTAAIESFEAQRDALPGSDLRRAVVAGQLRPYHHLLRLTLAQAGPDAAGDLLQLLERFRARAGLSPAAAAVPDPDADHALRPLRERLDWLYRRRRRLEDEGLHDAALDAQARRIEAALLEAGRRERLTAIAAAADGDDFAPHALCAALAREQAVVVFAELDDELSAIVLRHGGAQLVRGLARWSAVREACDALHNQIHTLTAGDALQPAHLPLLTARATKALARLHGLLWQPLQPLLADSTELMLVPTGPLAELPWPAVASAGEAAASRPHIVLAASARAALAALEAGARAASAAPGQPAQPSVPPSRVLAWADTTRLVHAGAEARAVAALFGEGRAFVGDQATRAALLEHGPQAQVLHFACHARFRRDNPSFSALQLADGEMSVEQVSRLRLSASLVVLGACETSRADLGAADDAVGLVQAFLDAGAERVLAAQWPVNDAVSARWMVALHGALAAGAAPSRAMDAAQRAVAREHPHPYFWTAFALHGRW